MIRKGFFLLVFASFTISYCAGQENEWIGENWIGKPYLKTVQLHTKGDPLSLPMVPLKGKGSLHFGFDDLQHEVRDYTYSIVHCNHDWAPSDLTEFEFLGGFNDNPLDEYDFSINTLTPYTHYFLTLPNEDLSWKKSGNYLLLVYDEEEEKELVMVRRFIVYENLLNVKVEQRPPSGVGKYNTHHEFDFTVDYERLNIRSPRTEIKASVIQNQRIDNSVIGLVPLFVKGTSLIFDYQDVVSFEAGKEFRYIDLSTFNYKTSGVKELYEYDDYYEITLFPDEKRAFRPYSFDQDINGNFLIDNQDSRINNLLRDDTDNLQVEDRHGLSPVQNFDYLAESEQERNLESDYVEVLFSLLSPTEIDDHDVYVFGALSDWNYSDQHKMIYNDLAKAYVAKIWLKQGFYDYWYMALPHEGRKGIVGELEGNRYETRNMYTFLIYYREYGSRYDRLVAIKSTESN